MVPPAIEAKAAKEFEAIAIEKMHRHLSWKKQPVEIRNMWRIKALTDALNDERNRWKKHN